LRIMNHGGEKVSKGGHLSNLERRLRYFDA